MSDSVLDLAKRGQSLAPDEREKLVELLLTSLVEPAAPEIEVAWEREIEQRVAAYQRGEMPTHDLDEVLAEARRIAP
jgi:putative addiction module component (TIGR02574 family)